jgi:hypothetical protein
LTDDAPLINWQPADRPGCTWNPDAEKKHTALLAYGQPGRLVAWNEGAAAQNWLSGGSTMTGEPGAEGAPGSLSAERAQKQDALGLGDWERDALLTWVGENLTLVRRSASGQRVLYWSLGFAFVLGLAAHVGGFLLKFSMTAEPVLLVADLLYALGWALWTGVVVVVFVEIWPETKKRQYKQVLDAYEAATGHRPRVGVGQALGPASAEDAG